MGEPTTTPKANSVALASSELTIEAACPNNDPSLETQSDTSDSGDVTTSTTSANLADATINNPINPPPSKLELLRDKVLAVLGGTVFHWIALVVLILVVIDGAFFFLLLIGAHTMCDIPSRWDCDPRNYWYNFSVQVLNVLFTYLATVSLPWKLSHAFHLSCSRRSSQVRLDLYGKPTEEIWFHICPRKRQWIVAFLTMNSLAQFVNQGTRIIYYNYELQSTHPGILWTNVFFVTSFSCGAIAAICQLYEETLVRKQQPDRFPPGPLVVAKRYVRKVLCPDKKLDDDDNSADTEDLENPSPKSFPEREEKERRRCFKGFRKWLQTDRTSLEMWGF